MSGEITACAHACSDSCGSGTATPEASDAHNDAHNHGRRLLRRTLLQADDHDHEAGHSEEEQEHDAAEQGHGAHAGEAVLDESALESAQGAHSAGVQCRCAGDTKFMHGCACCKSTSLSSGVSASVCHHAGPVCWWRFQLHKLQACKSPVI
jgi:hypothetical protein